MADDADRADTAIERVRAAGIAGACAAALVLAQPSGATHCRECGAPIALGRLAAVPAANHCIECATRWGTP